MHCISIRKKNTGAALAFAAICVAVSAQQPRQYTNADYAAAEQATMGFASIIDTLQTGHLVDAAQFGALKAALDQCYAATQKEEAYDPAKFAAAAQSVAKSVPR